MIIDIGEGSISTSDPRSIILTNQRTLGGPKLGSFLKQRFSELGQAIVL
jgi:hypothetical protein